MEKASKEAKARLKNLDERELNLVEEILKIIIEREKVIDASIKVVEIRKARAAGSANE